MKRGSTDKSHSKAFLFVIFFWFMTKLETFANNIDVHTQRHAINLYIIIQNSQSSNNAF